MWFYHLALPAILTAMVAWWWCRPSRQDMVCTRDFTNQGRQGCRPWCSHGSFSLSGMRFCQPLLTCLEINSADMMIYEVIGNGAVKMVRRAEWKGHHVALNTLAHPAYTDDFHHGLNMLKHLQPSIHITQLLGYCGDAYITEYHPLGAADNINTLLENGPMSQHDMVLVRFFLCISYAEAIDFLHHSPIGTRVMCDSNDIHKTLNQFLLTNDLKLVVNDLDALPKVDSTRNIKIKCGHREIFGDFAAPEQTWPYPDRPFVDDEMIPYDEKTDIWKIPDVCDYFLGNSQRSNSLKYHLFKIHHSCKNETPEGRPTSTEVLVYYQNILKDFIGE